MAAVFNINTPHDQSFEFTSKGQKMKCTLQWVSGFGAKMSKQFESAQKVVDSECLRYMDPLTPKRTGAMINSAIQGTVIGSGEIKYNTPYAKRQYYTNRGGSPLHPQARAKWFETMKSKHKEDLERAAGKEFS